MLGTTVLDGLGRGGEGPHADHEHVILSLMPERVGLLATLLLGRLTVDWFLPINSYAQVLGFSS